MREGGNEGRMFIAQAPWPSVEPICKGPTPTSPFGFASSLGAATPHLPRSPCRC
jgi:hypothetical protein